MLERNKVINKIIFIILLSIKVLAVESPLIFPIVSSIKFEKGNNYFDESSIILLPKGISETNGFINELLQAELNDKYRIPIKQSVSNQIPRNKKYFLLGTLKNRFIQQYCVEHKLIDIVNGLDDEGYILISEENKIIVASKTSKGVLYGFESLRQLIKKEKNKIIVPRLRIEDKPKLEFRGIKVYLPGQDNLPFFKRFIRDFVAKYKFNKIIIEFNANMRLNSHPEANVGTLNFADELLYTRRGRPSGPNKEYQNSAHQDNADGDILEKWEVAELIDYIRKFNIEVIPEIPSLTHSYYLLFGHKELAEIPNSEYPDTYCPLKPQNYNRYFEILNEYIKVIKPKIIHVGHDEWRMEKDICPLCRGKDYGELFAEDINKIYNFLNEKGIKMAIWGDHLLESVRGKNHRVWKTSEGRKYKIPGALTKEQVINLIPKDILIFNWFWSKSKDKGPANDKMLSDFGFTQVYGNFRPEILKWKERLKIKGLIGGAPSSWAASTEQNIGKDLLYDFLGCANLLWSEHYKTPLEMISISQKLMPVIREEMSGITLPSNQGLPILPVELSEYYNSALTFGTDSLYSSKYLNSSLNVGSKTFKLSSDLNKGVVVYTENDIKKAKEINGIPINKDVSSLIFLHASAAEGQNKKAYSKIYNFDDTAELLGWYEIVYDDGFVITIPIRYGVNILDWNIKKRISSNIKSKSKYAQNKYAYKTKAVNLSNKTNPVTFFEYEWINQRPGYKIKEVNIKAVKYNKKNSNAIILLALSEVGLKIKKESKSLENK